MKISRLALCLAVGVGIPSLSFAQSASPAESAGRELVELVFESVDTAERGFVDMADFLDFGSNIFLSMDYDENDGVSLKEFLEWDYGMEPLAQERGRLDSYRTALKVVFAFWDRNGNGEISRTEHRRSLIRDFKRADIDDSATLNKPEFFGGFSVMLALRAALAPSQ